MKKYRSDLGKKLNSFVGRNVVIFFKDGEIIRGKLGFTEDFSEKYGYRKPNYYTIESIDFLVSHIRDVEQI